MSKDIIPPNGMGRPRDSMCEAHGIIVLELIKSCEERNFTTFFASKGVVRHGLAGKH